jgi:hypothetical protein
MDLYLWLSKHIPWSYQTFGDGKRTEGLCKHIEKELNEIRSNPNDVYEWIDVVILALDGAWRAGFTIEQICEALEEKQKINKNRHWVKTPEDTPTEHVK